ncbi:hypothetical protein GJAV_G00025610 [Gymnothorax javanicus]|nr:hypothetical protein GJAV_G00025610 [Gymnothorax javanicus]
MSSATLTFLCVVVFAAGVIHSAGRVLGTERCLCGGETVKRVRPEHMLSIRTYPASIYCSKLEIVVTLKQIGKKLCLDPRGKQGKMILKPKRAWGQKKNLKRKRGKKKRRN